MQTPNLVLAFLAGLLSFLSPCVFPLIPVYIGYLSGAALPAARGTVTTTGNVGVVTMSSTGARWVVVAHTLMFMLGFTLIFGVVLGGIAGALSAQLREWLPAIQRVMGVLLLIFGLHMVGLLHIPWLDYTKRMNLRPSSSAGYLRSLLVGIAFAIGWTPCTSLQLGLIFTLATNGRPEQAWIPFMIYSLGLGIPFLLAALALGQIAGPIKRLMRRVYTFKMGKWTVIDQVNIVSLVGGVVLLIMAVLILTDKITLLTSLFPTLDLPNNL